MLAELRHTMRPDIEVSRSVAAASSTSHLAKEGDSKNNTWLTVNKTSSSIPRTISSLAGTFAVRPGVKSISLKLSEADAPVSKTFAR